MNINSISELSNISSVNNAVSSINADTTADEAAIKSNFLSAVSSFVAEDNETVELSDLNTKLSYNALSCNDMFVEVSYGIANNYKSYKFNLGKALTDIAKSLAWIAALNMNALTESRANTLYVPFTGNMDENSPAVSGLKIRPPANNSGSFTALSILGSTSFYKSNSSSSFFNINVPNNNGTPTIEIKSANLNSDNNSYCNLCNLTANKADVVNLSATALSANNLSSGRSGSNWIVDINGSGLSATTISANSLSVNAAIASELNATSLTATSVLATALTGTNITATTKFHGSLTGTEVEVSKLSAIDLSAGIKGNGDNAEVNLIVSPPPAPITISNLKVTNESIHANLYAGSENANKNGCLLSVTQTPPIQIAKLKITDTFEINENANAILSVKASDAIINIAKLNVSNGLTATAGISELTARAACWS